jgi:hypothetical protein
MKGKSFLRLEANDSGLSQLGFSLLDLESLVSLLQGVDYTCVLDEQFGCAFHCLILFTRHFLVFDTENDIKNSFDSETHI